MSSYLSVSSPYDLRLLAELPYQNLQDAQLFLTEAQRLHTFGPYWPKHKRITAFEKLAHLLTEEAEAFATLIASEGGKPIRDARVESQRAVQSVKTCVAALMNWHGHEIPMGLTPSAEHKLAFTQRRARGPVLAISAFNHPLNLIVHQCIPALAVGCPVLVKPSLKTPLSCLRFMDLLHAAGVPREWCQAVLLSDSETEHLAQDARWGLVSFIGSAAVGWRLRSLLAPGVSCTLEHGGAAPAIICADADLETHVPRLVRGATYHAGQVCVSVQNIFVAAPLLPRFQDLWVAACQTLQCGDPLDPATDIGPLIRPAHRDRVLAWIQAAEAAGGKVVLAAKPWGPSGLTPSVLCEVPAACSYYKDELFGPGVGLYSFSSEDELIARLKTSPYAFQTAVFTRELDRALALAQDLDATTVLINEHTAFRCDWMPFGGRKLSGQGVGGIIPSMLEASYEKTVIFHSERLQNL